MVRQIFILIFIILLVTTIKTLEYCDKNNLECKFESSKYVTEKYIFYDVNRPEGFNLRRDVYLRMAIFVKHLINDESYSNYKLVLPPWSNLYHWKSNDIDQTVVPWSIFFDMESLKRYAPVLEMSEFLDIDNVKKQSKTYIDEIYIMKHYEDMFENGEFIDKWEIQKCNIFKNEIYFWGYSNITAVNINCLQFQGFASQLKEVLQQSTGRKIMFAHAEIALHDTWGTPEYWKARRSMRFSKTLVEIATKFRKANLNSTNEQDNVHIPEDWRDEKPNRHAIGGSYMCVHLRRADFLWGRSKFVPSIEGAAHQILGIMKDIKTTTLFVATDATVDEYNQLKSLINQKYTVIKYSPDDKIKKVIKDGGVAIVDQIICSHARHFVGTYESTFSFRIQEQREILGFDKKTTFNRLCGDDEVENCIEPTQWTIAY